MTVLLVRSGRYVIKMTRDGLPRLTFGPRVGGLGDTPFGRPVLAGMYTALVQKTGPFYFLNNSVKMNRFLPRDAMLARYMLWSYVAPVANVRAAAPRSGYLSIHYPLHL